MGKTVNWFGLQADEDNLPLHKPGIYLLTNLLNNKKYVGIGKVAVEVKSE